MAKQSQLQVQEHEPPLVVMGRLREAINITGYGFNRVFKEYEHLLENGRWLECGYADFKEFVARLNFGSMKLTIEQRKDIETLTLAAGELSNRRLAKLLGVSYQTVANDLAGDKDLSLLAENSSDISGENAEDDKDLSPAPSAPQSFTLPHDAVAKLVQRQSTNDQRDARREERLNEIAAGNSPFDTTIKHSIFYADPPWRYENPPMGAGSRSIENHYPTMTLDEICAVPVGEASTDDALLYLWATAPKLAECMKVIEAWGFQYRTNLVWDKEIISTGYHARGQHELLLIAKRGEIPPPKAGTQPSSVHRERRGKHSAKPDFYYQMIEAAYPQLRKIELFLRGEPRPGWSGWGNQAETPDAA